MYVITHLDQVIKDTAGAPYVLSPENKTPLTVAHVIVQLIEATVVKETSAALQLSNCAGRLLDAESFEFESLELAQMLKQILSNATLKVSIKAIVNEKLLVEVEKSE
tara:strand:+ start:44 stop:364 length:321 start_codon:yes stop_codon:yes gene_type:complete